MDYTNAIFIFITFIELLVIISKNNKIDEWKILYNKSSEKRLELERKLEDLKPKRECQDCGVMTSYIPAYNSRFCSDCQFRINRLS